MLDSQVRGPGKGSAEAPWDATARSTSASAPEVLEPGLSAALVHCSGPNNCLSYGSIYS